MGDYHRTSLGLTKDHMINLAKGKQVKLSHANLSRGTVPIHMTKTKINRLHKAKLGKKGAMLKLSKGELRHNKLRGTGVFSNILNIAKKGFDFAKKSGLLKAGTNALANSGLIDKAIGKAGNYAKSKGANASIVNGLSGLASKGANAALNKLGSGVRHRRAGSKSSKKLKGGDLSGIPVIGPILHNLFGLGISKVKAKAIINGALMDLHKKKGHFNTHFNRRKNAELKRMKGLKGSGKRKAKKTKAKSKTAKKRKTKRGGSFIM